MKIIEAIKKVTGYEDLSESQTRSVFDEIMSGQATPAQISAFITGLRMKGETVDEITGAVKVMRQKAKKIKIKGGAGAVLDTCGTGGSGPNIFNISTTVAFVLAGCGVKVAKHGNRSASSHCGSADVLEELGVKISVSARMTEKCVNEIKIGFLFAPLFHGAMKYAVTPRKEIGIRTIFNILGPLANPAAAGCQLLGVYDPELTEVMARVLKKLGSRRVFVVHGDGPIAEVSIAGRTKVSELKNGRVRTYNVTPSNFGVKKATMKDIKGGTVVQNAWIIKDVLSGKRGPARDVVLINSSMALVAAGKVKDLKEGVLMAAFSIDSGEAAEALEKLIVMTNL
ncbi:MAG: anthranilate phosphoribosyltransferase [Candidatus Tantalella remota]|nr:anthranilate phosphoribosyltransferase [Candidatus Tantalella remota]